MFWICEVQVAQQMKLFPKLRYQGPLRATGAQYAGLQNNHGTEFHLQTVNATTAYQIKQ